MSILAIDYGDVRIGFAKSDPMNIIASSLDNYTRVSETKDIEYILSLIEKYNIKSIVIGLPKNMDGTEGDRVEITKEFVNRLKEKTDLKIDFYDERLTSVYATNVLIEGGVSRKKRKNLVDKVAASIFLQNYLDKINK